MTVERYGEGRIALVFGPHKFNVHPPGFEASIRAARPTPGSLDLCFLSDRPLEDVIARLEACQIPIENFAGAATQFRMSRIEHDGVDFVSGGFFRLKLLAGSQHLDDRQVGATPLQFPAELF